MRTVHGRTWPTRSDKKVAERRASNALRKVGPEDATNAPPRLKDVASGRVVRLQDAPALCDECVEDKGGVRSEKIFADAEADYG